ncbi:hypothetical protein B0H66DRAFT_568278 [Apodospora peruviana]|uniref:Uncharacterized protein n=1 Tax=Apodospora peruviana TaxID=516989 RepID=A0AAE0HWU8_9PEZI|nr:hypothetical protein B0H66DRAFT_568278 [Apodospora peruviana]
MILVVFAMLGLVGGMICDWNSRWEQCGYGLPPDAVGFIILIKGVPGKEGIKCTKLSISLIASRFEDILGGSGASNMLWSFLVDSCCQGQLISRTL